MERSDYHFAWRNNEKFEGTKRNDCGSEVEHNVLAVKEFRSEGQSVTASSSDLQVSWLTKSLTKSLTAKLLNCFLNQVAKADLKLLASNLKVLT